MGGGDERRLNRGGGSNFQSCPTGSCAVSGRALPTPPPCGAQLQRRRRRCGASERERASPACFAAIQLALGLLRVSETDTMVPRFQWWLTQHGPCSGPTRQRDDPRECEYTPHEHTAAEDSLPAILGGFTASGGCAGRGPSSS
jgi:hypothetical protein